MKITPNVSGSTPLVKLSRMLMWPLHSFYSISNFCLFLKSWVCKLSCRFFYQFTLHKNALQVHKYVSHISSYFCSFTSLSAKLIKSLQETRFSIEITVGWAMITGPHQLHRSYLSSKILLSIQGLRTHLCVSRKLRVRVEKKHKVAAWVAAKRKWKLHGNQPGKKSFIWVTVSEPWQEN